MGKSGSRNDHDRHNTHRRTASLAASSAHYGYDGLSANRTSSGTRHFVALLAGAETPVLTRETRLVIVRELRALVQNSP